MESLKDKIFNLPSQHFSLNEIRIRPIRDDYDLWFAAVECKPLPEQKEYVNPAGFSIGRAYLHPEENIPCIIWKEDVRIGYIVFRAWSDGSANSWSFYLDENFQGRGFGKTAAHLAVQILQTASPGTPIKLSTGQSNEKARRLYRSLGFYDTGEMDGNDPVFLYSEVRKNDLSG